MERHIYSLAGHPFEIISIYDGTHKMFVKYISDKTPEFCIETSQSDIDFELNKCQNSIADNNSINYSREYLETLAIYRRICEKLIDYNIVLFHCSAIEIDGKAYLFTAPSGTGKSTHARLWRERFGERVKIINDDKPLISFDCKIPTVYGTPYGGKYNLHNNIYAKIDGILIIRQARENTIEKLSPNRALPLLYAQAYTPKNDEKTSGCVLDNIIKLANLPVYILNCNISQEAVSLAYKTLVGNKE